MKKRFFMFMAILLIAVVVSIPVQAQSDFSVTVKSADGIKPVYIPWYVYGGEKFYAEARYDFDSRAATSAFVGKTFKTSEGIYLTPNIGFVHGPDWTGPSAQLYISIDDGQWSIISLYQLALATKPGTPNFAYVWGDLYRWSWKEFGKVHGLKFQPGIGVQAYREFDPKFANGDFGPLIKITYGHFYAKPWLTAPFGPNAGSQKVFLVVGTTF